MDRRPFAGKKTTRVLITEKDEGSDEGEIAYVRIIIITYVLFLSKLKLVLRAHTNFYGTRSVIEKLKKILFLFNFYGIFETR